MTQIENKPLIKVSPRRMQYLILGGAKIIEFQKFLGCPGSQMFETTVVWKDCRIFFTIHEKSFSFLTDAMGQLFTANERGCVQSISRPL